MSRSADLQRIVADYRSNHQADARRDHAWFGDAGLGFDQSVRRAALSRIVSKRSGREVIHDHQRRIGEERLAGAAGALAGHVAALSRAEDFDALLKLVHRAIGPLRRIGDLAVYDIAHRIGMRLGYAPTRVHLHAGTRDGARALGFARREHALTPSAFDPELQVLAPAEIEDLLCLYKKELASIAAGKPLPPHIGGDGCGPRRPRGGCS